MSPKYSSLAFDEVIEQIHDQQDMRFEPQLSVLVNPRHIKDSFSAHLTSQSNEIVEIRGRINVSF